MYSSPSELGPIGSEVDLIGPSSFLRSISGGPEAGAPIPLYSLSLTRRGSDVVQVSPLTLENKSSIGVKAAGFQLESSPLDSVADPSWIRVLVGLIQTFGGW